MISLALQWALGRLTGAFRLAVRYPLHAALIVAVVACVWLWRGKERAEDARDRARAETAALVESYRKAQSEAERLESTRLARVKAEHERIASDATEDYRRRLADVRARYDRLRAQADRGAPDSQQLPGLPPATGGTAEAPDAAILTCAEQAVQLDELITWTERTAQVR